MVDLVYAVKIMANEAGGSLRQEMYRAKLEGDFGYILTLIVSGVYDSDTHSFTCQIMDEEGNEYVL